MSDIDPIESTLRSHYEDHDTATVDGTTVEAPLWTLYVKEVDPYRVEVELEDGRRELVPPNNCDAWDDLDALLEAADESLAILLQDRRVEYAAEANRLRDD